MIIPLIKKKKGVWLRILRIEILRIVLESYPPHAINTLCLHIVSSPTEHPTLTDKIRLHQTANDTLHRALRLVLQSLTSLSHRKLAWQSIQHVKSFSTKPDILSISDVARSI